MMSRVKLSLSLVVMWVALSLVACQRTADGEQGLTKMRLAVFVWVGYAPIYLADEMGFFAERGLDVEIRRIEDTAARRAALTSGNLDGSVDIVDSFANAAAAGMPAKVVLKLDDSMGGDGILVRREFETIRDLAGKRVAYPEGQPSHFFLLALLEDAGMSISDIQSRPMEADQAGAAFIARSVDAAVTWEPWLTKAASLPHGRILTTSRETPGLIADVFTVHSRYLEENPEAVRAFSGGWLEAIDYWRSSPETANTIMAEALGLERTEFEQMVAGIHYSGREENRDFFVASESGMSPFQALMTRANSIWQQAGVIEEPVDPRGVDGSQMVLELTQ